MKNVNIKANDSTGSPALAPVSGSAAVFERMEQLRAEGWCVVLKCLPKEIGWIIEGSRSEYDAPCPDRTVGKGKWCCEVSWMGNGPYRPMRDALADTPDEAVQKAFSQVSRQNARTEPRRDSDKL